MPPKYRSVKQDIISFCGWPFLLKYIESTPSKSLRGFISGLFETGGRISEVLQLNRGHFDLSTHPELIIVRNMPIVKRFEKIGETTKWKCKDHCNKRWDKQPTPEEHGVHNIIEYNGWITKPIEDFRTIPIRRDEPLAPYLIEYLESRGTNELLFPISRSTAFNKVRGIGERMNSEIPNARIHSSLIYNHFFRSERACQLVDDYGFDIFELDRFFAWKSGNIKTAEIYARMGWKGLARRMGVDV